jgi:hypothetical protein
MHVAHDVARALDLAVDLVNSRANGAEALPDLAALRASSTSTRSAARAAVGDDLEEVHALRPRLRAVWRRATCARPRRSSTGSSPSRARCRSSPTTTATTGTCTGPSTSARRRLPARRDAGMALREVLRDEGAARLRACEAPGVRRGLRRPVPQPVAPLLRHRQLRQPGARGGVPGAAALRRRRRGSRRGRLTGRPAAAEGRAGAGLDSSTAHSRPCCCTSPPHSFEESRCVRGPHRR